MQAKRIKPSPLVLNVFTGTEWLGGSQQEVTWSSQGDVPTVMIQLRTAAGSHIQLLKHNLANTGSHHITVPTGLVPGEYRVHVESSTADKVCAVSGIILIDHGKPQPAISDVTAASAEWLGGSQQKITWSSQGDVPNVSLSLYTAAGSHIQLLHHGLANTGSCRITVPTGLIPGEYRVRAASRTADKVCAVSGIILIDHGKPQPAISDVTAASASAYILFCGNAGFSGWLGGSQQEVTWSSQGDVPNVSLSLYTAAGSHIQLLHHNLANTGSCRITVPTGLIPGEYRVRAASRTADKVCAVSGIILIDHGRTPPVISNVAARQLIWHSGSQQEVTWSSQGDVPNVHVCLYTAAGSHIQLLHHSLVNTGSHRITVPTGLVPGNYRVHIQSSTTDKACANSEAIIIDDEHRERCVRYALGLLGLPHAVALPYQILRKIAVMAASAD